MLLVPHPTHPVPLPPEIQGAVAAHQLEVYLEAVQADQEIQAFLRTLVPPPPPALVTGAHSGSTGPHSDTWWSGVSVCEQGGRNDSFFGYFSIMDGSAGGLPWATQVTMANGIISRYGDNAWAASCVADGYAASPSG